jgi:hypothetical protein
VRQRIILQLPGQAEAEIALEGPATAGGSNADAVHVPGLPAGALALEPCDAGVIATARVAGARVGAHPLAPGARRLLRPGERAELQGASIGPAAAAHAGGTRVLAAGLLAQAAAGAAPLAGPHLVVLTGPAAGTRLALGPEETLGRGRTATLRVADTRASRRHARVRVRDGGVTVEDLGSKNGLLVNGVRAERGTRALRPGDEVTIGETILALADPLSPAPPDGPAPGDPGHAPREARSRAGAAQAAAALLALAAALALAGL